MKAMTRRSSCQLASILICPLQLHRRQILRIRQIPLMGSLRKKQIRPGGRRHNTMRAASERNVDSQRVGLDHRYDDQAVLMESAINLD